MKFFNRTKSNTTSIPEDLQPYYKGENSGVKRWIGPVIRGLILLAVLILVVWGAIRLVQAVTGNDDDQSTMNTSQKTGNEPSNKPDAPATTKTPTSTPTPAPSSTPTQSAVSETPQQLANSGPGETVALFICVTIVAGTAFHLYQKRRLTN